VKLTNRNHYPEFVVNALKNVNEKYERGEGADISVTELISAPLLRILKKRHWDEITEDVEDRMYSFWGSLGHQFIENIDSKNVIYKEQRMFFETENGWVLSGQFDVIYKVGNETVLADLKFTSKYAVKEGVRQEWQRQLNIYKYIVENSTGSFEAPVVIDRLELVAPIRDATFLDDKIAVLPVKKFKPEKVREYIEKRVAFHVLCEDKLVAEVPECTPEERWQDPPKYAVCSKAGGKSLKNLNSRAEAEAHVKEKGKEGVWVIELRHQKNRRCEGYCSVRKFCWWWNDLQEGYITDSYSGDVPVRTKING